MSPNHDSKLSTTRRALVTAVAATLAAVSGLIVAINTAIAADLGDNAARWTADGELKLPEGYHSWVFLGAPLTPDALNNGQAGFPEYHNVYVQPEAYRAYRNTGKFPEGTILLKELQLTQPGSHPDGSTDASSGRGYFPAQLNGIDISVKDSRRFADTNGWGFFNFGHHAPPYAPTAKAQAAEACAACHAANATDMVFIDYYSPILNVR